MERFMVTLELTGHLTVEVEAEDALAAREAVQANQAEKYMGPFIEEVMPISVHRNNTEVWSI